MAIDQECLDNWFTGHPPDANQVKDYACIRSVGREFDQVIVAHTPSSADQTAAIRKIREAVMTARLHRM